MTSALLSPENWHHTTTGKIRVVEFMGGDSAVVQAARVSYGKGTKTMREDRDLIRFLMRHRHTSPFEQAEIKFHVHCPMDLWRQWIRHRTANVNEYSTRYSEALDSGATTAPSAWRLQAGKNKQGSDGYLDLGQGEELSREEEELQAHAREVYRKRLSAGVAREQARKDLPLSTHTTAYWKIDLHNLLHFLGLRMDPHAQWEIREFANIIGAITSVWAPLTWEAFRDYRLQSVSFSSAERKVLGRVLAGDDLELAIQENASLLTSREVSEFREKFAALDCGCGKEKTDER